MFIKINLPEGLSEESLRSLLQANTDLTVEEAMEEMIGDLVHSWLTEHKQAA